MKKINKLWQGISDYISRNPSEIIFGTYFLLVMAVSAYAASSTSIFSKNFIAVFILYTVFSLVPRIHRGIQKVSFDPCLNVSKKKKLCVFGIASLSCYIVLIICFIANYPGSFPGDSLGQYKQAMTGVYNDWHPVWHTLLIFTLPLKLTNGWIGSIVFFQIVYFSLLIGYMAVTIYKYAGKCYAFISVAFILLSPFTLEIVMYPWKDVAFAIASGFCMLYAINIYFTNGEWGNKFYRIVLLAFMLASATLFRHNGVLFSFFLLVALFFFLQKRKWLLLVVSTAFIFAFVKFPVYTYFKVEKPPYRVMETTGLPLSVILNVAKECPDRVNEHTIEFVSKMMSVQPDWKKYHNISGLNSVKYRKFDYDAIENEGVKNILVMMFHCFSVAPKQSIMALYGLTTPVYSLEHSCVSGSGIQENDVGIVYTGNKRLLDIENKYLYGIIIKTPLRFVFACLGSTILIMLAFILFKSNLKNMDDWKRIFLCLPIFTYNFGTMLFLSGNDARFFYVSFIICPLVVLIMCGKRESYDGI